MSVLLRTIPYSAGPQERHMDLDFDRGPSTRIPHPAAMDFSDGGIGHETFAPDVLID